MEKQNKKIYLVGGAVRDMIMQCQNYDKDYVAVGFVSDDFFHLRQVGKDFPVFLREDGSELALARIEKKVSQGYNGFEMDTKDVSLDEDLKRRDLTINSIAYDEDTSSFIDPFDGQKDIKSKILKHTSEAFIEDPIRVLRLARFRAKYGIEWKIHASTKVLVYQMRDELKSLQKDRVYKEIKKVFAIENTHIFFETLFELGVLDVIFPSIYQLTTLKEGSIYHMEASVFEHTMMILKELKNESELLKATTIYHDIAKPYCYRKYGNSAKHDDVEVVKPLIDMQLPTKVQNKMLFIIANHIRIAKLDQMKPNKIASFFESFKKDKELFIDLLKFFDADNKGRIMLDEKRDLDEAMLLGIFEKISNYSPKKWIESQETTPSGDSIKQHVHRFNINVISKYFK